MKKTLQIKLSRLTESLRLTKNSSASFFEKIQMELEDEGSVDVIKNKLKGCYSIVQYASFNRDQEELLSEIIDVVCSE